MRELMGFRRSSGAPVDVRVEGSAGAGASSSTIVIGTRRRFGGAVDVVEGGGEDAGAKGVETSRGADRCRRLSDSQEREESEEKGKEEERGRTALPFFSLTMSQSTRTSSALTASLFGSSLSALWRSEGWGH